MLVEHGYDLLEAERRAIAAMGDPEEIGRAWNEKLSPFWLWVGRIAKTVCIVLLLCNCTALIHYGGDLVENLQVRMATPAQLAREFADGAQKRSFMAARELDIKREFGGQVVQIYRVELHSPGGLGNQFELRVYTVAYAQNPFDPALNGDVLSRMTCNGEPPPSAGGSTGGGRSHRRLTFPIERDTEKIELALNYLGNSFTADVILDWGGEGL